MTKYRVIRKIIPLTGDNYQKPIWEGENPSEYTGGIGAFDEGDIRPSRWFEVRETCYCGVENVPHHDDLGNYCMDCGGFFGWREIADPRK